MRESIPKNRRRKGQRKAGEKKARNSEENPVSLRTVSQKRVRKIRLFQGAGRNQEGPRRARKGARKSLGLKELKRGKKTF